MIRCKQKRPSADKTRHTILQVATRLFAKHGFAGTSIRDIAQTAQVSLNLITHHYESKKNLWKQVRLNMANKFEHFCGAKTRQEPSDLKMFLERAVSNLFGFWQKHPEALRILNWQRLEAKQKSLMITSGSYSLHLQEVIGALQTRGQVRQDVDADIILLLIFSTIHGALEESSVVFQENKAHKQKTYLQLAADSLYKALKT